MIGIDVKARLKMAHNLYHLDKERRLRKRRNMRDRRNLDKPAKKEMRSQMRRAEPERRAGEAQLDPNFLLLLGLKEDEEDADPNWK